MVNVILVDENDNEIGVEEKLKAHQDGKLHRAFSIFIFNSKGELMLQKRAKAKYHSGGLWTNTVCSHPLPDEDVMDAAHRRLKEEMGFDCNLEEVFTFVYKAKLDNELTEHEFDHVVFGQYEDDPKMNPEEAEDWKWISLEDALEGIKQNPDNYTFWFKHVLEKVIKYRDENDQPLDYQLTRVVAELKKKNRILQETLRKERDILDILGHELRTPLTIARNATSVLEAKHEAGKLTKEVLDKYLDMADENLDRESKLLETLLSSTKISNDAIEIEFVKVDLIDVVNDSLDALRSQAEKKGLKVAFDKPESAFIKADRNRMQEVTDNLIDNAIKYTKEGNVTIAITIDDDGFTNLSVQDSGVGISDEDMEKLGQKFYRTNTYLESSKESDMEIVRPGGTGLGLYVVFNLVRRMQGKLDIQSKFGQGSTFSVGMPTYVDGGISGNGDVSPRKGKMTVYEKFEKMKRERDAKKDSQERKR